MRTLAPLALAAVALAACGQQSQGGAEKAAGPSASGRNQVCVRADAVYTAYDGGRSDSYAKTANICVKAY